MTPFCQTTHLQIPIHVVLEVLNAMELPGFDNGVYTSTVESPFVVNTEDRGRLSLAKQTRKLGEEVQEALKVIVGMQEHRSKENRMLSCSPSLQCQVLEHT